QPGTGLLAQADQPARLCGEKQLFVRDRQSIPDWRRHSPFVDHEASFGGSNFQTAITVQHI
ncbi:MAG: hypothetical protein VYA84_03215, partial [Planctomycetota bacterium]|nr:hypothetical protein [Planctomycetota bacterium]